MVAKVPFDAIKRQLLALFPVYMNILLLGCTIGWIQNAIYYLKKGDEVYATKEEIDWITSLHNVGKFVAAIPGGIIVDKYGRKIMIVGVAVLNFISWWSLSMTRSVLWIGIGQFVIGICRTLIQSVTLITIGEIASAAIRGKLTLGYQICATVGVIFPAVVSVVFSSYKVLNWAASVLASLALFSMVTVSETPSFLINSSKLNQARDYFSKIRRGYSQHEIDTEFENLKNYIEDEKERKRGVNWMTFMTMKNIRRPVIICVLIKFFITGTGRSLVNTYVTKIFPPNDYIPTIYYPLITQVIMLCVDLSTTTFIDRFPRRKLLMFGAIAVAFTNVFFAVIQFLYLDDKNNPILQMLFVLGYVLYLFFFNSTVQPINSILKTEMLPQVVKGLTVSLCIMSESIASFILIRIYSLIATRLCVLYMVFAADSFILCYIVYRFLPESRGLRLDEIRLKFLSDAKPSNDVTNSCKNESNSC